jgi:hypothetical protein
MILVEIYTALLRLILFRKVSCPLMFELLLDVVDRACEIPAVRVTRRWTWSETPPMRLGIIPFC